jgi:hypothetical protein
MILRCTPAPPSRRSSQSGYAYLMALLMVVAMFAATTVFLENALTQAQRRREAEMIWRGKQYVRAIRLYFHKTGHYPQDLDALQKGLPQLHFLRQAYKDPMNTSDGSWRFIYVNAAGQIIGSTRFASLQQMALIDNPQLQNQTFPQLGVSASTLANASASSSFSAFSSTPSAAPSGQNPPAGNSPDNSSGTTPPPSTDQSGSSSSISSTSSTSQFGGGFGTPPGQLGQSGFSLGSSDQPLQNPILAQKPTGPVDGPVLGAFLTGVASKVDSPSLKWFHHAKKYKEWEFIWNPLDDQAAAMQNQATAIPLLGQPAGGSAFGQGFGSVFGQGGSGASGPGGSSPFGSGGPGGGMNPVGGPSPQPQPQGNQPQ